MRKRTFQRILRADINNFSASPGRKWQKKPRKFTKVALVYDRVNKWGGAERVLLALHEIFPKAPLYTSVYNPQNAPWANVFKVKPSFLQGFPFATRFHQLYAPLMPFAFKSLSFKNYDLVISVTSEAAKGIQVPPNTVHVCYCLTPTRYLWSGYSEYFKNPLFRFITDPVLAVLKLWDIFVARNPDYYVAISQEVQRRIKKYYRRESSVIYPALNLASRKLASSVQLKMNKKLDANALDARRSSYYLIVSRLVPYKRIDIAIEACNRLKLPLVIVGRGSEEKRLKHLAGETITFVDHLTDQELLRYYRESQALLFPGIEDFGLAILEAQFAGKPVIAYRGGGALETVIAGKTGEFFYPQSAAALAKTLRKFHAKKYKPNDCKKQARKFNKKKFFSEWKKFLENI